jgi:hypothetical protein
MNALPRPWDKHDHAVRSCLGGIAGELRSLVQPARVLRCIDIGAGPELRYSNLLFWSLASITNVPPVDLDVVDPTSNPPLKNEDEPWHKCTRASPTGFMPHCR